MADRRRTPLSLPTERVPDRPVGWRQLADGNLEKWCSTCRGWKAAGLFHNDRTEKDGKRRMCMGCVQIMLACKLRRSRPPAEEFNGFGTFRRHRSLALEVEPEPAESPSA